MATVNEKIKALGEELNETEVQEINEEELDEVSGGALSFCHQNYQMI